MELSHSRVVPAPPQRVWDALNDPETLKACIPGCESFVRESDHQWAATVNTRIGPVSARFTGKVELADVNAPVGYTLRFAGQGGAAGFANGEAKVALSPVDGGTSVAYIASAKIGGKLAQIGSRLVDGAAAKIADDFFQRFAERVAPAPAGAAGGEALAAAAPVPTSARGRAWIRWVAIAALAALLFWLAKSAGYR
ncbi:MAG: carbon monoxide dehydrogenase subunit G [Burkholderiales bacterium]